MSKSTELQNNINYKYTSFLLLLLFLLSVIVNLYLYLNKPGKGTVNTMIDDKYSLLSPTRNFIDKKDMIVNIQPLRDTLNEIGRNPKISVYFEYLPTGANISINKDAEFFPASLLKVPTVMASAKKIQNGIWRWENELVLMASDKDDRFGDLWKEETGSRHSIEYLVKKTLTESDDTANYMLVRNLEPTEIQDIYNHLGLEDFFSEEGKISAKKYSIIFRALYSGSYLSDELSEKILGLLTESKFSEYLQSGVPKEVKVAHKFGISDEKNVILDSGIVYLPNRPYLLTIMIETGDVIEAKNIMNQVSKITFDYINEYKMDK